MTKEEAYSRQLCFVCFKDSPTIFDPGLGILYHQRCADVVRDTAHSQDWNRIPRSEEEHLKAIADERLSYGQ